MPSDNDKEGLMRGVERTIQERIIEASEAHVILPKRFVGKFKPGLATPNVANIEKVIAGGVVVTVTNFKDGQEGQSLDILGDGFTTVANNTKIATNTGADKLLEAGKAYRFTKFQGKWVETVGGGGGGGGGGTLTRGDVVITTAVLANGAEEIDTAPIGKTFVPVRVVVNHACRLRLYETMADALADDARLPGTQPSGEHGLILDLRLDGVTADLDWSVIDPPTGTNMDNPVVEDIAYIIKNESGASNAITATITRILLEA